MRRDEERDQSARLPTSSFLELPYPSPHAAPSIRLNREASLQDSIAAGRPRESSAGEDAVVEAHSGSQADARGCGGGVKGRSRGGETG